MQNHITTSRLLLDILAEEDHEFIVQLLNSKGWLAFIGDRNVHSTQEALAYIQKILSSENLYYWVVRKKDGNVPVGIISFIKRNYLDNFDIGFAFLPEFNGCGYAYEAAKEVLAVASADHFPILATTIPDNVSSIKLLIKLGLSFKKELTIDSQVIHIYSNEANRPESIEKKI